MPHPTKMYKSYDKRHHLDAPEFTRSNHRYRGPRESSKVNLEIGQLIYSFAKLGERYDSFQEEFSGLSDILLEGGVIEGVYSNEGDVEHIEIHGLNEIAAKIQQLNLRINNLRESSEALGRFTEVFQSRI